MRTQRTNGSVTYTYLYNGSQLTQMTRGSVVMRFSYGTDGRPLVISYNDTPYYYITNLQGDVVAIVNSSGTTVVKYTYDAWGRLISTTGTMASTLGQYNPLRYRGYIYDQETGLYYLQSRYYNPTWGRFLNADSFVSTGQGMLGNNMFAYCGNNPVSRVDETGLAWKWLEDFGNDVKSWLEEKKKDAQDNENVTKSFGITGSAAFGVGGSFSLGITYDTKGNLGIILTVNGGGGLPSVGLGLYESYNNAPTIYDQRGLGTVLGASGGPGIVAVGGEYNMIIDQSNGKVYHGGTVSATYGFYPTVVEVHGEVGNSWVWGFNIYDFAIGVIDFFIGN